MLVYFTSGTTGMPKMVQRDHGYALAHIITGRFWMDLEQEDIHWTLSDTGWAKAPGGCYTDPGKWAPRWFYTMAPVSISTCT